MRPSETTGLTCWCLPCWVRPLEHASTVLHARPKVTSVKTTLEQFTLCALTAGGRLVFFMPATPDTYRVDQLPTHPTLQLVDNTEQLLTTRYSRRLVTMQKVRPYDAAKAAAFKAQRADFVMDIDRIHEIVYAQDGKGDGVTVADGDSVTKAVKPKYRSKMC
eukprot:GHUV01045814.1.p1 GENE.GHUV01045814.1~~GHUV01045814.1.p1  ORF type:complete len:162 (-),score=10.82 GHUV01045814.1:331-816(-)